MLSYLQLVLKVLNDARELGQAEHALARQVRDVRDAEERQHVVFAERVERDLARDHQLVVAAVVWKRRRVERRWPQELRVHRGDPAWRVREALGREVGAHCAEELGGGAFSPLEIDEGWVGWDSVECSGRSSHAGLSYRSVAVLTS